MEVYYFDDVRDFLRSLDKPTRSRTYKTVDLLKQYGNQLSLPQSRALGSLRLPENDFYLKDPEFKRHYDALEPEFAVIRSVIGKRIEKKMSQKQLARKIGTKQSAISRLESGGSNPSLKFLQKVATALGARLSISFV